MITLTCQVKGLTVSEGKWRWVELPCWFVLSVLTTLSEWLVFSLMASGNCRDAKGDFSLLFLTLQSDYVRSGQPGSVHGGKNLPD